MEIWELTNLNDGWQHPIHIHFEEGRILSKTVNGIAGPDPGATSAAARTSIVVGENMTIRVLLRFRDFKGKYLMHCHNLDARGPRHDAALGHRVRPATTRRPA
jgi:FtsP/CotA-like multicopper oxidase with cupredoxin domain